MHASNVEKTPLLLNPGGPRGALLSLLRSISGPVPDTTPPFAIFIVMFVRAWPAASAIGTPGPRPGRFDP